MNNKTLLLYNPSFEKGGVEKNIINLLENKKFTSNFKIKIFSVDRFHIKKNNNVTFQIPNLFSHICKKRFLKYIIASFYLFFNCFGKDIIIVSFQNNIFSILISILTGRKIIIRLNTSPEKYIDGYIKKKIFKFFYAKSNLIVCNSMDFQNSLLKYLNLKSILINNFVNIKKIQNLKKEKLKKNIFRSRKDIRLISIGRIVDQKNHILILKSLKYLKFKYKLLLIGEGDLKNYIQKYIINNNLSDRVMIINFQKNPYKYLYNSDIFILSSKFEGMPNILIESGVVKTLIISSNCPTGPKEIITNGKTGFLFKNNNVKSLANSLNKSVKNINNKKILNKMFLNVRKKYDMNKNIETFIKIINRI